MRLKTLLSILAGPERLQEIRGTLTHERFFSARQRRDGWRMGAVSLLEIHSESHDHTSFTANAVLDLHQHGISPCILDYC